MDAPFRIGTIVLVASVAVCMTMNYTMQPPLSPQETFVVVGVITLVVAGTRRWWSRPALPRSEQ
jgi:uncharacterized membrane protein